METRTRNYVRTRRNAEEQGSLTCGGARIAWLPAEAHYLDTIEVTEAALWTGVCGSRLAGRVCVCSVRVFWFVGDRLRPFLRTSGASLLAERFARGG